MGGCTQMMLIMAWKLHVLRCLLLDKQFQPLLSETMQIIKHHTAIELKNQFSPFYIFILSYQWYLPMWSFWLVQHGLRWIWTIPTSKNCSGCIKHEILSTIFMITPFFKQILSISAAAAVWTLTKILLISIWMFSVTLYFDKFQLFKFLLPMWNKHFSMKYFLC